MNLVQGIMFMALGYLFRENYTIDDLLKGNLKKSGKDNKNGDDMQKKIDEILDGEYDAISQRLYNSLEKHMPISDSTEIGTEIIRIIEGREPTQDELKDLTGYYE